MTKSLRIIFVFLMVVITFRFFDARFINSQIVNAIVYLTSSIAIFLSLCHLKFKKEGFVLPVILMIFSIFISILMANQFWGQSFGSSLKVTLPYLTWIFFFYLLYIKISIPIIEKIILICGVLYIVLYFFQLSQSPTVIFGKSIRGWDQTEFSTDRGGIARIVMPGGGIFFLLVFMAISKFTTSINNGNKRNWWWLLIIILGPIIPFLQETRQFIFSIVVIYLYHFTKKLPIYKRIVILVLSIGVSFYLLNMDNSLIEGLTHETKSNLESGDDYVRIKAGEYYLKDFSPTTFTRILGNGAPDSFSTYGAFMSYLQKVYGYFLSDVGLIAMYAMFGVLSIIAYFLIWIKSFSVPLPEEYAYLKYYLWFLLITSLTWYSVYHYHFLITTVFVLYLYHVLSIKPAE